jgi:hypothetical protein
LKYPARNEKPTQFLAFATKAVFPFSSGSSSGIIISMMFVATFDFNFSPSGHFLKYSA